VPVRRTALLAALVAACVVPACAAAAPGPALTEPAAARLAALRCYGDLAGAPKLPVLLVHGTHVDADGNWHWGYRKALVELGHGVCTVDMPERATVDVQRSVEYFVGGLREMHERSGGRKVSVIGHSQGGFHPIFAARVWPDVAEIMDDFIGLAGAYDNRVRGVAGGCPGMCIAAFKQISAGSRFATQLARRRLPPGPSYTAIASLADTTVTPQPAANELPYGAGRSMQIQDVCPGRAFAVPDFDHVAMAGDAVAYELALDALDHPGTADPARISKAVCANPLFFPRANLAELALRLPDILANFDAGTDVAQEPPLRCYMDPACPEKVLAGASLKRKRGRVAIRLRATRSGSARVRFVRLAGRRRAAGRPRRSFPVSATARPVTVELPTRSLRPGRYAVEIQARAEYKSRFVRERALRLQIPRR
jgi:hypothetical protein